MPQRTGVLSSGKRNLPKHWKNISPKNGKDFPQNGKPLHLFGWLIWGLRVSRISNSLKRKAI
jgi:hypothetical protein